METVHILVVDDELGMRLGVRRALHGTVMKLTAPDEEVCLEVESVDCGEAAKALLESSPPDILLLDHKLPDLTGLELLDFLGARTDEIITVMITAYASLETAIKATKRGAYDFLAKPFTPEELRGVVRKAVRHLLLTRQAQRLAEEKRQVRFQFISVLAHEMKAPIGAVQGYLRIIRDKAVGDAPAAYDQMLDRSLIRLDGMRKMIADLLDMTAIESGHKQRELKKVDVIEIITEAIENVSAEAADRGITLEFNPPSAGELVVTADRTEMEMIANNLISNAVKYNRDNGQVRIDAGRNDHGELVIVVADTGIGMTPAEQERLFKDFSRIKNSKTRHILGSGLGLSTIKKIAELYNGEIQLTSEPEVGTTVTVRLPAKDAEAANNES